MFTKQFFDLLLNLKQEWKVKSVEADYKKEEVFIKLSFTGKKAKHPDSAEMLSVYDHAPERKWRHLDIMQYKTYICCCLPRVKDQEGKVTFDSPGEGDTFKH